jgi:TRAP-type transport system small permease protein
VIFKEGAMMAERVLLLGIKVLLVISFCIMALSTFLQVIFRYVFYLPLAWSEELSRFLFIWAAFLASALGVERHAHFGIDFMFNRLSKTAKKATSIFTNLLFLAFLLIVIISCFQVLQVTALQLSPALDIPMSYVYLAMPIGCGLMAIFIVRDLVLLMGRNT